MTGLTWFAIWMGTVAVGLAAISGFGLGRLWAWVRGIDKHEKKH
jgi:hypothetical protein